MLDIAKAAGVSRTTVSSALSGSGRVSASVKERVLKVAEEMDYNGPNAAALLLKKKRIVDVALVSSSREVEVLDLFAKLCEQRSLKFQYELIAGNYSDVPHIIKNKIASGVLFHGYINDATRAFLAENLDVPVVDLGDSYDYSVYSDFDSGAYAVIRYLAENGHRHIATTFSKKDLKYSIHQQVRAGAQRAIRAFNLPPIIPSPDLSNYDLQEKTQVLISFFEKLLTSSNPPSAIFASGSPGAFTATYVALKMGLRIPDDLSIVSIGSNQFSDLQYVSLSTLEHDFKSMVSTALDMLKKRIDGEEPEHPKTPIPVRFIVKNSIRKLGE